MTAFASRPFRVRYSLLAFLAVAMLATLISTVVTAVPSHASARPDGSILVIDAVTEEPIAGATVKLYQADSGQDTGATGTTGIDGYAVLGPVPSGIEYTVSASADGYGQSSTSADAQEGQPFSTYLGLYHATHSLSGTIFDDASAPLGGVLVSLECFRDRWDCGPMVATTADDGSYSFPSLAPADSYAIKATKDGYPTYSKEFELSAQGAEVRDIRLALPGTVSGRVVDSDHNPIAHIHVDILAGIWAVDGAQTDEDGKYSVVVPAGTYTARFSDGPYIDPETNVARTAYETRYSGDATDPEQAVPFSVTGNLTTIDIDATLAIGASISGHVGIQTPDGVINVSPNRWPGPRLYHLVGQVWTQVVVPSAYGGNGGSGSYTVGGLPAGTYRIGFEDDRTGNRAFTPVFWNNQPTVATATSITVAAGDAVTGKDATIVTPEPNYAIEESDEQDFTEDNAKADLTPTTASQYSSVTLDVGSDLAGEWVSASAHSTPVHLGADWVQVPASGKITVPVPGTVVPGAHKIAVQAADGSVLAWSDITIAAGAAPPVPFSATTIPTITGSLKSGGMLSAKVAAWTPNAKSSTYQWMSDLSPVIGSTGPTFTTSAEEVGHAITVAVTGHLDGYIDTTTVSAATGLILPLKMTPKTPTISGTAKVGKVLTAKPGKWSRPDVTFSYQWLRSGKAIVGETNPTHVLSGADYKKYVTVKVTGLAVGYTTVSATSAKPKKPTAIGTMTKPKAGLSNYVIGSPIQVIDNAWTPADAVLTYKWKLGTKYISGATSATFTPSNETWVNKKLTAVITAKHAGYTTVTLTLKAVTLHLPPPAT